MVRRRRADPTDGCHAHLKVRGERPAANDRAEGLRVSGLEGQQRTPEGVRTSPAVSASTPQTGLIVPLGQPDGSKGNSGRARRTPTRRMFVTT